MFIPIYHIFIIRAHNARSYRNALFVHHTLQLVDEGNANDTEQYIRFVKNKIKAENTPTQHVSLVYCKAVRGVLLYSRMQHM